MSRIYVGRLPYQAREKEVERFFRGFGRIRDINLKNGFGFVELDDPRDADDAVYELNGRELLGERVIVEHARGAGGGGYRDRGRDDGYRGGGYGGGYGGGGRGGHNRRFGPPVRTDFRIVVENVSSRVSWQDLKDFMRQAGEITYADAHKMRVGEGVVEYASYSDMKNAVRKLDGAELNGRRIRLYEDSRSRRKSSRSRSRSRDRKRSRSRNRHSRSRSRHSRSRSRSRSRSKSRSPSRSRSRSRNRSGSRERSRDRSRSRDDSRERSAEKENGDRGSRSRSGSEERRDRSRSPSKDSERGRSRSLSPKDGGSPRDDDEPQDASPAPSNEPIDD